MPRLSVILLWLVLTTLGAGAQEPNIPKVYFQDFADHSIIWAENQLAVDATMSFHLKEIINATPDRAEPIMMTVKPGRKIALVHLKRGALQPGRSR